jgi:hypothetical protein
MSDYFNRGPARDARYLRFIRTLPCSVPGCRRSDIEASHSGPHALGRKASDYQTIPLCTRHHRTGDDSYHRLGPKAFQEYHGIDLGGIIRALTEKPRIRVVDGRFIGAWRGDCFDLGPVHIGAGPAASRMLERCREAA